MRPRSFGRFEGRTLLPAWAIGLALLASARVAGAEPLSAAERGRLERGEVVRRTLELELAEGRYVGGLSYAVIHAPVREVMRALTDVSAYPSIFPLAIDAREVGRRGADPVV